MYFTQTTPRERIMKVSTRSICLSEHFTSKTVEKISIKYFVRECQKLSDELHFDLSQYVATPTLHESMI
jgi:hypothetical protein